ncbi:TPA: NACHT domain-containing NTPase [Salmonella enterica]|uniref:NACHT domain-containing protein n=1 Tax=Salmonella enterica TaxID=28901 RepID=UPI0009AAC4EE|nr:hypothetical protein [Salmonella enterica]
MISYIAVDRRFYKASHPKEEIPEHLYADWFENHTTIDWNELLKYSRTVILADAGAGKTCEMKEQVRRLKQTGLFAFFIPIEALTDGTITELLIPDDATRFRQWQAGTEEAYFFLDSVDELKLKGDKFEKALRKFQQQIQDDAPRIKLFVTCRPKDWSDFDLSIFEQWFPACTQSETLTPQYSDKYGKELLLDIISEWDNPPQTLPLLYGNEEQSENYHQISCFYMRPMSNQQIRKFTEGSNVKNITQFLQRLYELDAEIFAGRPRDLITLIDYWNQYQKFDSTLELYEHDIRNKLTETTERTEHILKSSSEIRIAVEKLALAISITHKRTISIAELPSSDPDSLDPTRILTDWSLKEINSLLRLAIFDPATYERVRFHHRSVQEYLAACRLKYLTNKGMSVNERFSLLFSERYNISVVLPSMRSIAAWLSLHDREIRKELMKREPETLLSCGDPGSLPIEIRTELLKHFIELYSEGTSRGINIPLSQVAKLSHPELKPAIEHFWRKGYRNDDVRELLLEIIWTGKIQGCSTLLKEAIYDQLIPVEDRLIALKAVDATGDIALLNSIIDDIIHQPSLWPDKFIFYFSEEFFPRFLSIHDLSILVQRTPEPKSATSGFKWVLYNVAEEISPLSDSSIAFRNMLTRLIVDNIMPDTKRYYQKSRFGYLCRALVKICAKQIMNHVQPNDKDMILSCLVSCLFMKGDAYLCQNDITTIRSTLNSMPTLREYIFETEYGLIKKVSKEGIDTGSISANTLLSSFTEDDFTWMLRLLHLESEESSKMALLIFILRFVLSGNIIAKYREQLISAVEENDNLLSVIERWFSPEAVSSSQIKKEHSWERRDRERIRENERKKCEDKERWIQWHHEIITDETALTSEAFRHSNLEKCMELLIHIGHSSSPEKLWNKALVTRLFGENKTKEIEKLFFQQWRKVPTSLWSNRSSDDKHSLRTDERIALTGLYAESLNYDWYKNIKPEEASRAVLYAALPSDSFLPAINQLALHFPNDVKNIISHELQNIRSYVETADYIPVISNILNSAKEIRELLKDVILEIIISSIYSIEKESSSNKIRNTGDLLYSIIDTVSDEQKKVIATSCASAYLKSPYSSKFYPLLRYTFTFHSDTGLTTLKNALKRSINKDQYIIELFAAIFSPQASRRDLRKYSCLPKTPEALGELLSIAYRFIRREDDREHDGMYHPDTRDNAVEARNNILSLLLDTQNTRKITEMLRLLQEKQFSFSRSYLEFLVRERVAISSEILHLTEDDVVKLDTQLEQIPHDQHSLFTVMINRLNDLQYALSHSDFTDRDILCSIKRESQMQATLAWRLEAMAKSAYSVVRESEVADGKKTDIRLIAPNTKHKVVIELKIADNQRQISDFERALEHQLVGQYLRYEGCKSGCLLLTYNGNRKYWVDPVTRKRLNFDKLIDFLNVKASKLMDRNSSLQIKVVGFDLTAPKLVPAHH